MPELPEVEVTRLSFAHRIEGALVEGVAQGKPLRWPLGCLTATVVGQRVLRVRRRGKYLLMDLDRGILLWHLGMSGSLKFDLKLPPPGKHDHFDLLTSQGILRLHDPRRFGAVVYDVNESGPQALKLLGRLGMEPLSADFDPVTFHSDLKRCHGAIKQVLLAGDVVVGVGNIYASEALYLAGIRPTVKASRLTRPRVVRLHGAIREVLTRAVEKGGSTLRDFSNADGNSGYFQLEAMVYDRAGLPCRRCGGLIRQIRQGQRSTFFCASCQSF